MVSQAPRLWKQLLQQLEAAPASTINGQLDPRVVQAIFATAGSLRGQPALTKATWKKLVKDMQVPAKLCTACFQQPDQHQLMALPFALALHVLLGQAMDMQGPNKAAVASTAQSFLQQLEECGMQHHLSRQLSATAHQLWDVQSSAADLATQLQDPAYTHAAAIWSRSSSPLQQLHQRAGLLCAAVFRLHHVMFKAELRWHKLLLQLAVPAVELSVLTLQHISSCLDQLPLQLQQAPSHFLWHGLSMAQLCATTAVQWCASQCSCCEEVRQQLQQSPYCIMAISITLLVASYTTLMAQDLLVQASAGIGQATGTAAVASGSSRGGGSNSSSNSRDFAVDTAASGSQAQTQQQEDAQPQQPPQRQPQQQQQQPEQLRKCQAAWDMACAHHESLPLSHQELLRLTGCSGKALLWVSGSQARTCAGLELMVNACNAFDTFPHDLPDPMAVQQQPAEDSKQLSPAMTAMLFLVPVVVLHWGSYYLLSTTAHPLSEQKQRQALMMISLVCTCGTMLLSQWRLPDQSFIANTQQLLQQLEQKDNGRQLSPVLAEREDTLQQSLQQDGILQRGSCQEQRKEQLVPPKPALWPPGVYLQVLSEALQLGEKVLLLLQRFAAGSGNSGTSGVTSSSSTLVGQLGASELQASCANSVAGYLSALQRQYMAEFVSDSSELGDDDWPIRGPCLITATNPRLPPQAAVWFEHAPQLCIALEGVVRQRAANVAESAGFKCKLLHLIDPVYDGLNGVLLQAAAAAGPCSKQQVPLYCLLRSMVKWAAVLDSTQGHQLLLLQQGWQRRLADELCAMAAVAAVTMLARSYVGCPMQLTETAAPTPTGTRGVSADSTVCVCDASSSGDGIVSKNVSHSCSSVSRQQGVKANSLHVLPWLGLLGCCCLQMSAQLQQHPEPDPELMQDSIRGGTAGVLASLEIDSTWDVFFKQHADYYNDGQPGTVWGDVCQHLRDWCALCTTAEVLQAGGYDLQPLLQQLDVTAAAVQAAAASASDEVDGGPQGVECLAAVIQQLAALGQALSSVAHKRSCNNPACTNLSGSSELQLVKGQSNTCSGCRTARYCSKACMKQHWKQHRPVCQAIAKAAVATAGATPVVAASTTVVG